MKIGFTITRHIEFEDNNIPSLIMEAIQNLPEDEDEISDLDLLDYLNEVETDCRNVDITDDTSIYEINHIEE